MKRIAPLSAKLQCFIASLILQGIASSKHRRLKNLHWSDHNTTNAIWTEVDQFNDMKVDDDTTSQEPLQEDFFFWRTNMLSLELDEYVYFQLFWYRTINIIVKNLNLF